MDAAGRAETVRGASAGPSSAHFLRLLRAGIGRFELSGQRILAACSGGPDSLALLIGLAWLGRECGLEVRCGTVDHGLREGSGRDALYVRRIAGALGVPCEFRKLTLNLRGGMGGVEAQAREARYAALHEMAAETGCSVIATAHTLNDQAETLLMRLGSGTGLLGARGILRKSGIVVRPMLEISRQDVLNFLNEQRLRGRTDPTNASGMFARNRVRQTVLPALEEALGPGTLAALGRFCDIAAGDSECLEAMAAAAGKELSGSRPAPEGTLAADVPWIRDAAALLKLDAAIRFRVLRDGVQQLGGRFGMELFQRMEASLRQHGPRRVQAEGGVEILFRYGQVLMRRQRVHSLPAVTVPPLTLEIPEPGGTWSAVWQGMRVRVRHLLPGESAGNGAVGIDVSDLERAAAGGLLRLPLVMRFRRAGDVFRPGGVGTKKLKEFLIDARIPAEARGRIPLLTDSASEVLYVIGRRESSWLRRRAGVQGGLEIAFVPGDAIEKGQAGG